MQKTHNKTLKRDMGKSIQAGEFSRWINDFTKTMRGIGEGCVPCGECVACCTSAKFIHIRPTDKEAIKSISKDLMFDAPGLPEGHYLLGYDKNGHCPMLNDGKCSIYEYRPETCKQYDCRALAAVELSTNDESPEIAKRVESWVFDYSDPNSIKIHKAVKLSGLFLSEYASLFPSNFIPRVDSQVSVLALRIHKEFIGHPPATVKENYKNIISTLTNKYSR